MFVFCFCILQYYTASGLPGKRLDPNICAVCGNPILVLNNEDAIIETTCKLDCDHVYPLKACVIREIPYFLYKIFYRITVKLLYRPSVLSDSLLYANIFFTNIFFYLIR